MMKKKLKTLIGNGTAYIFFRTILSNFNRLRYGLYRVHPTSRLVSPFTISQDFELGPYSFINHRAWICSRVKVGKYVMFGPGVTIAGADHNWSQAGMPIIFSERPRMPETIIEDDVWIGANAMILAGKRIGRGSIVAMGSVVTKDIASYTIVAGVPAKPIRSRFNSEDEKKSHDEMLNERPRQMGFYCKDR